LIRLAVRVRRAEAELVLAELLELAPAGLEEVEVDAETVEYAVYGAPGELPQLPDLRAAAGSALVEVATREVGEDWARRWREFHRPLQIAERLTVRPPWEPARDTALDVVIDPGQAFGTGAHPTTRLCLELMLDLGAGAGRSLVDVGCGSGVLAIVAAGLGFAPVVALDYEAAAVRATAENARLNGASVAVRRWDLRADPAPEADVAVANVLAGPLVAWAATPGPLAPTLILSGILSAEADRVTSAFARRGYAETERRELAEWSALALVR